MFKSHMVSNSKTEEEQSTIIQTPKDSTIEMEIHHPKVEKKNFKEYLLEGLMIFVAVTLGFFAEGIRENITDSAKENEYILSMTQDLRDDTSSISKTINELTAVSKVLDTMLSELKSNTPNATVLNNLISSRFWLYTGFSYNNRTVQQLKNA